MDKIDLKREYKSLYSASAKEVNEVNVPAFNFLMIDGDGDPNTSNAYKEAIESLFSVSYAVKFKVKKQKGLDYVVMPLEGLWWAEDMSDFHKEAKGKWKWTMMIMQSPSVTKSDVQSAIETVHAKKGLVGLGKLRFEKFKEGHSAQTLHIGPFSEEGPTIQRVHEHIANRGKLRGTHHEIYLSDTRRAASKNWKTIIRQPME